MLIRSAKLVVDQSPTLSRLLVSSTADELLFDLGNGTRTGLRAFPCSSRGLRGYPISTAVMDESAFFVTTDEGNAAADQVFRSLQPATAQFGQAGRMLIVSSPMGSTGFFAERWQRADSGELAGWVGGCVQISTAEMNPAIPADFLAQIEVDEPDTFGSEYLALFEAGSSFLDLARFGPAEGLAVGEPRDALAWTAALDPAVSSDAFGVALLGRSAEGRLVVGPVLAIQPERKRGWTFERKRSAQDRMLAEVAELCGRYAARVYSDQHESVAVTTRLRELGLAASVVGMTRETKYRAFKELRDRLYDGSLELPEHPELFEELARVQSKIEEGSPFPKIILPRTSRGHADQAQALALATWMMRNTRPAGGVGRRPVTSRPLTAGLLDPGEVGSAPAQRSGRNPDPVARTSRTPPRGWPGGGSSIKDRRF